MNEESKALASNRAARHFYEVLETYEAGISLLGHEVKSMRNSQVQIKESYAGFINRELWLFNCHVTPWSHHTHEGLTPIDPLRPRKLLMHVDELRKVKSKADEKGLTLVPLKIYLRGRKIKIEIALCKGKKVYDKRESIKKREMEREQAAEKKGFR
jgi:SsrA-binding protein